MQARFTWRTTALVLVSLCATASTPSPSVIAQDKVEDLKTASTIVTGTDSIVERNVRFDRVWTVSANTPHPGLSTVTVTVTPQRSDFFGRPRSFSMSFYRAY